VLKEQKIGTVRLNLLLFCFSNLRETIMHNMFQILEELYFLSMELINSLAWRKQRFFNVKILYFLTIVLFDVSAILD